MKSIFAIVILATSFNLIYSLQCPTCKEAECQGTNVESRDCTGPIPDLSEPLKTYFSSKTKEGAFACLEAKYKEEKKNTVEIKQCVFIGNDFCNLTRSEADIEKIVLNPDPKCPSAAVTVKVFSILTLLFILCRLL